MLLQLPRQRQLDLSRPKVMGILNITPDSFPMVGVLLGKKQLSHRPEPCWLLVLRFWI